jgi:2'-hydroxyisoflavone reductase
MRVLILGGGVFLGRALARAFLARGWETVCLTRGRSRPGPVEGVRLVAGDRRRAQDLAALGEQEWDAVVDTCAYRPADLEAPLEVLGGRCDCWLLVSTISVYAPPYPVHPDETAPQAACRAWTFDGIRAHVEGQSAEISRRVMAFTRKKSASNGIDRGDEDREAAKSDRLLVPPVDPLSELAPNYGALKAMCEDLVADELGERALIVRPGLIVGPEDPSERFTWWVRELAACGAEGRDPAWPDAARQPFQLIDGRDLAGFCAHLLAEGASGAVHVAGPDPAPRLVDVLAAMARQVAPACRPRPLPEEAWREAGLRPWADLPLWLPESEYESFNLDLGAATGAGLRLRPLEETVRDTLAWLREHAPQGRGPGLAELTARVEAHGRG